MEVRSTVPLSPPRESRVCLAGMCGVPQSTHNSDPVGTISPGAMLALSIPCGGFPPRNSHEGGGNYLSADGLACGAPALGRSRDEEGHLGAGLLGCLTFLPGPVASGIIQTRPETLVFGTLDDVGGNVREK